MLKDIKNHKLWISTGIALSLLILIFLPTIINNEGILIFYGDSYEQFFQFMQGGWERIRAFDFNDWSWNLGLGANFYSYALYFPFSIFMFIAALFPKEWLQYEFLIFTIIKFLLAFIFSYLWSMKIAKKDVSRFVVAIIYAFSGWAFFYLHYNYFLEAYMIIPLILYFTEDYLVNNKYVGLVISCFFLTITSFYFMYVVVTFISLYALFRYLIINKKNLKLTQIIITGLKYLGFVILGILMGAFILLPAIYALLGSPRLESGLPDIFMHITKYDLLKFVTSAITPVFSRIDPDYFVETSKLSDLGWGYGCSLFSMILSVGLMPMLLITIKKYQSKVLLAFYSILSLFLCFPIVWLIVQRSIDTRWLFIFVIFNAYTVAYLLEQSNWRSYIWSILIAIIGITILVIYCWFAQTAPLMRLKAATIVVLFECFFLLLYAYGFRVNNEKIIISIICIEALFSGSVFLYFNSPREASLFNQNLVNNDLIDYLKEYDDDFYRIIFEDDYYNTPNEPLAKYYPGTSFYVSVYNYEQEAYLDRYKTNWAIPMVTGRTKALNQLATKYYYTKDYKKTLPFGYEYLDTIGAFDVYENKYFMPLAILNDKTINGKFVETLPHFIQDRIMMDYVVTDDSSNNQYYIDDEITAITNVNEQVFELQFEDTIDGQILYLTSDSWLDIKIEFFNENGLRKVLEFSQPYYVDIYIEHGMYINKIIVSPLSDDVYVPEYNIMLERDIDENYAKWYESAKQRFIEDISIASDKVTFNVDVANNDFVVTSIPYDKGWTLSINGVKSAFEKVNFGFIGFPISKGNQEIVLEYNAPLKNIGWLVSGVATFIFAIMIFKKEKKHD